jgi:hypothetical protein
VQEVSRLENERPPNEIGPSQGELQRHYSAGAGAEDGDSAQSQGPEQLAGIVGVLRRVARPAGAVAAQGAAGIVGDDGEAGESLGDRPEHLGVVAGGTDDEDRGAPPARLRVQPASVDVVPADTWFLRARHGEGIVSGFPIRHGGILRQRHRRGTGPVPRPRLGSTVFGIGRLPG